MTTTAATPDSPTIRRSPTTAVLLTEARLFGRELGSLFWILLFPLVLLGILGSIPSFRRPDPQLGGLSMVDLYVPVVILMSMIMAGLMAMPSVIYAYREAGVLRRLRTTPVRPTSLLLSQVVLHAAAVAGSSLLVLVVARLVFGTPLPQSLLGYAVAYVLVLLASFSLGTVVTAVAADARTGTVLGTIAFFISMFTAGVYFPVQAMSGPVREIVALSPLGAATESMTAAMVGDFPDVKHLLVVGAWAAVLSLISVRTFRWE